ncbi:hypothetical protein Dimus_025017 [Dionaea muscipula]
MDYLLIKKKVNLPRVIIRHMAYVINVSNHELPYGELLTKIFEAFSVPLNHKKGEDPKRYDYFEETFLTMCQLKRIDGKEAELQGEEQDEKEAEDENSGSGEKFFYAMDDVEDPVDVTAPGSDVIATAPKGNTAVGVDPSGPSNNMLDFDLLHLQAEFARDLQRNTRFQELYQELKSKTPSSQKP